MKGKKNKKMRIYFAVRKNVLILQAECSDRCCLTSKAVVNFNS